MPKTRKTKTKTYTCPDCQQRCEDDTILCEGCFNWMHRTCQRLCKKDFDTLGSSELGYWCRRCCVSMDGSYDMQLAQTRLRDTAEDQLRDAAARELIFLRAEKTIEALATTELTKYDPATHDTDATATEILEKVNSTTPTLTSVRVLRDGSCLFNSLSVALCGTQRLALELRIRTALELIINRQEYERLHNKDRYWNLLNTDYHQAVYDCIRGSSSTGWTLHAAASALRRPIVSLYPAVNGMLDPAVTSLNKTFQPLKQEKRKKNLKPVVVMWSSFVRRHQQGTWTPDHFVPVLERQDSRQPIVNIDGSDSEEPAMKRRRTTPPKVNTRATSRPTVSQNSPPTLATPKVNTRATSRPTVSSPRTNNSPPRLATLNVSTRHNAHAARF
ncbi:Vertnin [Chionoecetes opilio]|uniref:Vertnin n=1 Tax=Chionoecetes opilio TaxID=41210 RepID=A0A8J4Y3T7_CHIOP|nr:Vertnin [Chionoecetes opilio]